MGAMKFRGKPCVRCGDTLRYVNGRCCVACERLRQRNKKRPVLKNEKLMWLKPVLIDGVKVKFSPLERDIFAVLFNARGEQIDFNVLVDAVWGHAAEPPLNTQAAVSVNIYRIRSALAPTRFRVVNDWGRGYRLERLGSTTNLEIAA